MRATSLKATVFGLFGLALLASCSSPEPVAEVDVCDRTAGFGAEMNIAVPNDGSHDAARLSRAVIAEINTRRCRTQAPDLALDPDLNRVTQLHSNDMAERRFYSSASPVPGRENLSARLTNGNITFASASESLQQGFFMQYDKNASFRTIDAATCRFQQSSQGNPVSLLRRHTYTTLPQDIVGDIFQEAAQRSPLLNPDADRLGTAIAATGGDQLCGSYVADLIVVFDR